MYSPRSKPWPKIFCLVLFLAAACRPAPAQTLTADAYYDKVRGAWQTILVANYTGLVHEGKYLDAPGAGDEIELVIWDEYPTDDDTLVEWVDLHILETHGLEPSPQQIRDEWVDHLNHDIWVSTRRARDLMDEGYLPPETGSAELNPDGVWSIDAQLQTELFGMLAPGMPDVAAREARRFAQVTNSGFAVDASAFYAVLYALAFLEPDVEQLLRDAEVFFGPDAPTVQILATVRGWRQQHPQDWRATRRQIRDRYDTDPMWWAARVNFASTLMALLYGEGDLIRTMTIAALAGWDADNNVTTAAGLLALIRGYDGLPAEIRAAGDLYYNEDVTGDLPRYQTVAEIARRTQALAEQVVRHNGGFVDGRGYHIATGE